MATAPISGRTTPAPPSSAQSHTPLKATGMANAYAAIAT